MNHQHFQQLTQDREDSLRLLNKPSMRGIRAGIVEKYSEKAHFVYELLQNADDAGASEVRFSLRKIGLYFIHNGTTRFTISDPNDNQNVGHINAITAIGDSTKRHNSSPLGEVGRGSVAIGKFGIGFKAVFQYTNTPHIYDPNISFKIRDLIVPVLLEQEPHPLRKRDETLFYFPFDRIEKTAKDALDEIEEKLKTLQFPLLFLKNIKKITWDSENGTKGTYNIKVGEVLNLADLRNIEIHVQTINKKTIEQPFLRFSKPIKPQGKSPLGDLGERDLGEVIGEVQIIFLLDNDNSFNFYKKQAAFCFFPTKVMTGLRFLVHAPFLLSDSREGIKAKEDWNEKMIANLAELLQESIKILSLSLTGFQTLSGIGIESFFQTLPYDRNDLDPMFAPLADATLQCLQQNALLPAVRSARFQTSPTLDAKVSIKNAYLAENKATQLLDLQQVFGENAHWVFPEVLPQSKFFHTIKTHLTANGKIISEDWLKKVSEKEGEKESDSVPLGSPSPSGRVGVGLVFQLFDTLSHEERLKLMQSVEPNANYAVWEEVLDYDLEGLSDFLAEAMTFEKSLSLWNILAQNFNNQIFIEKNLYGTYTFSWQNEQSVPFEALYWKRLKTAIWLYDKNENLQPLTALSPTLLHENYERHQDLLHFIFTTAEEKIDRFAHLTDEEKRAFDLGKRLLEQGFSSEDLLELRKIKAKRSPLTSKGGIMEKSKAKKQRIISPFGGQGEEDNEAISSAELLRKKQELRNEMEEELEEKIEQLVEIEELKLKIQESERYSMAWFKALLRLEYMLAYEKQEKERSFQIHFDRIEREEGTNKTILLKRPSKPLPHNIEDAGDLKLKLQVIRTGKNDNSENRPTIERINLEIEVVSIKDAGLRAKLKSPDDIADLDFSNIRGATLEVQNTIFILEELIKAFEELPFEDTHNVQQNLQEDIRFIFGPPGTGKTTYLVREEIQPAMLADDPLKILVLTPTNKAADVLVKKTQQMCGDSPEWLMRFGTTAEMSIENAGLLYDNTFNISEKEHFCVVTTITRFPYDGFNSGAFDFKLKNIAWDVIILDEASMIGLGEMALVLQQCRVFNTKFVIGGDPFQIEPVVLAEDWKSENIYSMARLTSFDPVMQRETLFPHPYKVENLTTQYRSINTIGALYSHFAYDSILRHHRFQEVQKKVILPNFPLKDINIIEFPTHKMEILYRPQLLNKSHYHIYSALLTVEMVQYFAKNLHQHQSNEKFRIGVICPYKAQATLVDKLLSSLHLNFKNIEIQTGTIHSFQGDECNIVLCLFNPPLNISKSPHAFLNKMNILNVAISRARDYLVLLMPDANTDNVENLYQINRLKGIIKYYLAGVTQTLQSAEVEQIIFQQSDFLYENTFATTHQSVNVYTQPEKKYEIRIEETAVDVQVHLG